MRIRLPWKLTFVFCFAAVLGLVAGYFYLTIQLKSYLEVTLQNSLKNQLLLAKDFIETHIGDEADLDDADMLADRIGAELKLRATIITAEGEVIGDTDLNADAIGHVENHLNRPEVQAAKNQGFGVSKRYSSTIHTDLLYMAVPFGKGEILGYLRLAIPLSSIELFEAQMQKIIFFALALIFLLSLGLTYIISIAVSRPLIEMAKIAQAMAEGDFSRKPALYSSDEVGDLARALTHMSDEIKDKIEKIKQQAVKLDVVLASMFEGIIVTDEKGTILLMNPSIRKLFFIDVEPEGKKPIEIIRNAPVQNIVDRILKDKQRLISEEIAINQPEEKVLKINGVPIIRDGALEGSVLVFHDITELRRLERIRQDFVANVSHELRTPIASIKGYAETLLEGALKDKDHAKEFVNIILQDSNRLASLIDDLLDLAKIESGKVKMVFMPLELKPLVKKTLAVLEKTAKEKSLSLHIEIPDNLPKVSADDKKLSQVLLNLLDNAVKYTPDGGSIKITAFPKDKFIQVDVADTGAGIPDSDIARIFERFYRVDKARSRELGGTGLGLSIVKQIVHAHQGSVWVTSKVNGGSTFSFTLPQA